jgi:hypothetical protein
MRTMRFRWAATPVVFGLALGCGEPRPALTAVEPARAGSDRDVRLTLLGHDFVPATIVDPFSGRRIATSDDFEARVGKDDDWAKLVDVDWLSSGALAATLSTVAARELPTGRLDVEVTDPRGQMTRLSDGFDELGADTAGPVLTLAPPAAELRLAPGTVWRGTIHAVETFPGVLGSLSWTPRENESKDATVPCRFPAGTLETDCGFLFDISPTLKAGDLVSIWARGVDAAGNQTEASLSVKLLARPTLASIAPERGGTQGGTDVVILGTGFLPGSTATLDGLLLFPDGGIVVDEGTISGHAPAHEAGNAYVVVHTPLGDTSESKTFAYRPPPTIVAITPNLGASAGGTAVTIDGYDFTAGTRIYFGRTLDDAVPLSEPSVVGDSSMIGHSPAGSGVTTVWAFDSALGFTQLVDGFTWRAP